MNSNLSAHLFVCRLLMSPLVICGRHHTHLTLDFSQNAMGHQRALGPKALLAVCVTVTTGRRWGVSQSDDWVGWVSVSVGCHRGGMGRGWRGSAGRRRGLALEKRIQFVTVQPNCGAFFLGLILRWVPALVLCLVVEQSDQEVDVLDSKTQDFILAELLVRWVCGNEFSQLRESPVHVLLSPALTAVCEDTPGNFLRRACKTQILWACGAIKDAGSWYTLSVWSTNPIKQKCGHFPVHTPDCALQHINQKYNGWFPARTTSKKIVLALKCEPKGLCHILHVVMCYATSSVYDKSLFKIFLLKTCSYFWWKYEQVCRIEQHVSKNVVAV